MEYEYPRSHMTRTMILDGLIFLIGMALLATPVIGRFYPGDIDTTSHVGLGAGIATLAIFRVLLAYGSVWIEVALFFLGLVAAMMPVIMVKSWNHDYTFAHHVAGFGIMILSVISGLLTLAAAKHTRTING